MAYFKTEAGWSKRHGFPGDPVFLWAIRSRIQKPRKERVPRIWPTFPPIESHNHRGHSYRLAVLDDLDPIVHFVDDLLAGKDFFCPRGQHIGYFKYKTILVCFDNCRLVGWAVRQKNGSLIHLLVDPEYRGQGIGSHLLESLEPLLIRSKSDQSTGDPRAFYEKHGYTQDSGERAGKNKNIDLLSKPKPLEVQSN